MTPNITNCLLYTKASAAASACPRIEKQSQAWFAPRAAGKDPNPTLGCGSAGVAAWVRVLLRSWPRRWEAFAVCARASRWVGGGFRRSAAPSPPRCHPARAACAGGRGWGRPDSPEGGRGKRALPLRNETAFGCQNAMTEKGFCVCRGVCRAVCRTPVLAAAERG